MRGPDGLRLPDFVVAGAPKCGTTAMLRNFREKHPRIDMRGEIDFFNFRWKRGLEWYSKQFPEPQEGMLIGEKTPSYFYGLDQEGVAPARRNCHRRLHEVLPQAKLIVCLRNPIDRIYSHWRMRSRHHENYTTSLGEAVALDLHNLENPDYVRLSGLDLVQKGFYVDYLENLLRYYPRERVLVCITERLWANLEAEYNRVFAFLGVELLNGVRFRLRVSDYEKMWPEGTVERLRSLYAPYNRRLRALLDDPIPEWEI